MDRTTIYSKLSESNIPCAHMCFPSSCAPNLPFCVFYSDEDDTFSADNSRYSPACTVTVELYEKCANETTESTLEAKIAQLGVFTKEEQWVEEENCLMIVYRFKMKG